TPEDFVAFVTAARRDPATGQPDMAVLGPFLGEHPETVAGIQAALGAPPIASWLSVAYNGIHAFRWIAQDGSERFVRTRWVPDAGEESLTDDDANARDRDYLAADL